MTDNSFIISPRITFEVSVRLLGGLMALGYTIAAILKRSTRVFSDGKATVKIDWLEQLNRQYIQVSIIFVVWLMFLSMPFLSQVLEFYLFQYYLFLISYCLRCANVMTMLLYLGARKRSALC